VQVRRKTQWRAKLHPVFFELADLNRQFEREWERAQRECKRELEALGSGAFAELRAKVIRDLQEKGNKLETRMTEKLVDINRRYGSFSYNPLAYSYLDLTSGQSISDDDHLAEYLHWLRHRESLQTTVDKDVQGDLKAYRKLARTGEDLRRVIHKKGQIKRFQGDIVHRQLLELILCYKLKPLTAEERAACVDYYCACGKTHDADALKRQAARLKKELQASVRPPATSSRPPQDAE
jgi:hypothetical protein